MKNQNIHLIACVCCGQRWFNIPQPGQACPFCFSSATSLGALPSEAIQPLVNSGIPNLTSDRL